MKLKAARATPSRPFTRRQVGQDEADEADVEAASWCLLLYRKASRYMMFVCVLRRWNGEPTWQDGFGDEGSAGCRGAGSCAPRDAGTWLGAVFREVGDEMGLPAVRSFVGACSFFRKHIKGFAQIQ